MAASSDKYPLGVLLEIERKVAPITEAVKTRRSKFTDYPCSLFLLSLLREEIITPIKARSNDSILKLLQECLQESSHPNRALYLEILMLFSDTLNDLDPDVFNWIVDQFKRIDKNQLNHYFPAVFDNLITRYANTVSGYKDVAFLPKALAAFIASLYDGVGPETVFNPFAGLASFGLLLKGVKKYIGQETNRLSWALGNLRILAYKPKGHFELRLEDSVLNWVPARENKFDLIITAPPLNVPLPSTGKKPVAHTKSLEHFSIWQSIAGISENGTAIIYVSPGVLSRSGSDKEIRKYLIQNDLLQAVITLPSGVLKSTSSSVAILVLGRKSKGKIKLYNGVNLKFKWVSLQDKFYAKIKNSLDSCIEDGYFKTFTADEIRQHDYVLHCSKYLLEQAGDTPLHEILVPIKGTKTKQAIQGPYVRVRDLQNDPIDHKLNIERIASIDVPKNAVAINESCLLIANKYSSLKPTIFEYLGKPIYISTDVSAFRINKDRVLPEYLVYELYSKELLEQYKGLSNSGIIPYLKADDLLQLRITLPEIALQVSKFAGAKEQSARYTAKERELMHVNEALAEYVYRSDADLRHTFRNYLGNLKDSVNSIRKFILRNSSTPLSLSTILSEKNNETIDMRLFNMEYFIELLVQLVSHTDDIGKHAPRNVEALQLIDDVISKFDNSDKYRIIKEVDERLSDEMTSSRKGHGYRILVDKIDFINIISNIFTNMEKHGFRDRAENNIVKINLMLVPNGTNAMQNDLPYRATSDDYSDRKDYRLIGDQPDLSPTEDLELRISNNGRPLPTGYTFMDFITRGNKTTDSTGMGLGGAQIKFLCDRNKIQFDLLSDPDNQFPVTYVLKFRETTRTN